MGILHNEISREFIAVPDTAKGKILFKWPDINIRKYTRAIVDADELAVFLSQGAVVGTLDPGQHKLEATEIPFLGLFIDHATDAKAYRTEIYFVGTREYTGNRFGGHIDEVQDPQTGLVVTMRVFGDYALKVADAGKLILNLVGTIDPTDNATVTDWVNTQLLKVMRTEVTRQVVRNGWPILGLSAYTPELEQAVLGTSNTFLADYGLLLSRMGNFDINLGDDDEARLKELAGDSAYTRLAGGFTQAAAGRALMDAGKGMAQGGGGTNPALLVAGMGMGQTVAGAAGQASPPVEVPPAPGFAGGGPGFPAAVGGSPVPAGTTCASCHAQLQPGAKFCPECGTAVPVVHFCSNCGTALEPGMKFCSNCGTAVEAPAAAAAAEPPAAEPPTPPATDTAEETPADPPADPPSA